MNITTNFRHSKFISPTPIRSPLRTKPTVRRLQIQSFSYNTDKDDKLKPPSQGLAKKVEDDLATSANTSSPKPHHHLNIKNNRPWSAILLDKLIDSADDIFLHFKRFIRDLPTTTAMQRLVYQDDRLVLQADKPVVLVLGSGWGAHSLIKVIDTDTFEVVCVSPSNAFLFTPMLPTTAVGTCEFRSLLEPIRIANEYVTYCEATCDSLDVIKKVAFCTSAIADGCGKKPQFEIPYDYLVVAVGERPASFGVPGVEQHAHFLKEIKDAVQLRLRIQQVFELASLPGTSEEEIKKYLHFVIVGGGPTGVEVTATLSDFLRQDLRKKYPQLIKYVCISLLQSAQSILTQFDSRLAARALENFNKLGVEVRTGVRVIEITSDFVILATGEQIEYGVCVWSAGNAPRQLVLDIAKSIPQQAEYRNPTTGKPLTKLAVDPFLRVIGAHSIIALGDCAYMTNGALPATAQVAAQQGAYAAHVINRGYQLGVGGENQLPPWKRTRDLTLADRVFSTMTQSVSDSIDEDVESRDGSGKKEPVVLLKKPFEFLSLGILAAIGDDKAIAQVELFDGRLSLWGDAAFLLWKSVYLTKQVSFRNRVLILFDWMKTRIFGRDLSQF